MSDPEIPQTCTLLLAPHDTLDRILVIRSVDGFPTHWMNHYGAWMALPDTMEGMQDLMVQLDEDPTLLPQIDMEYVEVAGESDEQPSTFVDDQVPFGD
jgi:hypothetical protein